MVQLQGHQSSDDPSSRFTFFDPRVLSSEQARLSASHSFFLSFFFFSACSSPRFTASSVASFAFPRVDSRSATLSFEALACSFPFPQVQFAGFFSSSNSITLGPPLNPCLFKAATLTFSFFFSAGGGVSGPPFSSSSLELPDKSSNPSFMYIVVALTREGPVNKEEDGGMCWVAVDRSWGESPGKSPGSGWMLLLCRKRNMY
mmetsp:Transcript_13592/g.38233  ORF Transcript_13592/g.38233 Transcript_13592/m.38233 type:complete len:202 (-) Transcript_13592:382-987(-)